MGVPPSGKEWRWIADHPAYMVSSQGDVRHRRVNAPFLAGETDPKGYRRVKLDGKHKRVARLVCEAFHGPCPVGHECAHVDGNKNNNEASNLAWVTRSENTRHSIAHGTFAGRANLCWSAQEGSSGALNPAAKLTEADVVALRKRAAQGASVRRVAAEFGISPTQAHRIIRKEKWANV